MHFKLSQIFSFKLKNDQKRPQTAPVKGQCVKSTENPPKRSEFEVSENYIENYIQIIIMIRLGLLSS